MRERQKLSETETIREFLHALKFEISIFEEAEKPDVYVTGVKDGNTVLLDIEHTDYFTDSANSKGGSPGASLDRFWRAVQDSFAELISKMEDPPRVGLLVVLKPGEHANANQASQMASELIRFAEAGPDANEASWVTLFETGYPLLRRFVEKIYVHKVAVVGLLPHCQNTATGNIGVDLKTLAQVINGKNKKSTNYSWREGSHRLLLISTNSGPITSSAPGPGPDYLQWDDPELEQACKKSPFQSIFLWNRVHTWYKQLKPSQPGSKGGF